MSLIKKSDWPSLMSGSWLSDFFDNDRFFDSGLMRMQSIPAVNVIETEKGFEIEVAAPGLSRKDFKVSIENRILTISSEKKEQMETKEKDFTRQEFSYSSFTRSFALPENVLQEDIKARYEDGVLKLALNKKVVSVEKARKAIEVQ